MNEDSHIPHLSGKQNKMEEQDITYPLHRGIWVKAIEKEQTQVNEIVDKSKVKLY